MAKTFLDFLTMLPHTILTQVVHHLPTLRYIAGHEGAHVSEWCLQYMHHRCQNPSAVLLVYARTLQHIVQGSRPRCEVVNACPRTVLVHLTHCALATYLARGTMSCLKKRAASYCMDLPQSDTPTDLLSCLGVRIVSLLPTPCV
jgi:hypothetical protein